MKALSQSTGSGYHIGPLSGVVAVTWSGATEVIFVNTYRMTVVRRISHGIMDAKVIKINVADKRILLEERGMGCINVWKREGGPASEEISISVKSSFLNSSSMSGVADNRPSVDLTHSNHLVLDITNSEDSQISQMLNYVRVMFSHVTYRNKNQHCRKPTVMAQS